MTSTVAVVGATGFVGSHIVPRLADAGHHVRAISRGGTKPPEWPGNVEPVRADIETGANLRESLAGADVVVHLAAIPREGGGRTFENVNVRGVERVLDAMRANGVPRIVHLSVLGATPEPRYEYLSSKWRGEQLVREAGVDWVVFRPSLLFGRGDGFFNLIKTTLTWWSPGIVAIPGDGRAAFQPLSVDDLATAVLMAVEEPARDGSVYELGGPERVTYREIVRRVMRATGKRRLSLNMPVPIISALTAVTDRVLPIFPVSHDQIRSLGLPNVTEPDVVEREFGFDPRPFDVSYLRDRA
jgi:NADH dehydrogenase